MADEVVCGGGIDTDHDHRDVSPVAGKIEDRSLVSQYGFPWTTWPVLRDGYFPFDTILRDCVYGTTWIMALSEPL